MTVGKQVLLTAHPFENAHLFTKSRLVFGKTLKTPANNKNHTCNRMEKPNGTPQL